MTPYKERIIDGSELPKPAKVLIRGLYNNETGGIATLFRPNVVKDCTPVSLNQALLRLIITPVSLVITQFSLLNNAPITLLIMIITISSLMIGLKKSYFPLTHLQSCYQTACYWIVCYWKVQ